MSLKLCATLADEEEDTFSGINQLEIRRRINQIICQTINLRLEDVTKLCKGCKQMRDGEEERNAAFVTHQDCDTKFVKNIVGVNLDF